MLNPFVSSCLFAGHLEKTNTGVIAQLTVVLCILCELSPQSISGKLLANEKYPI